MRAAVVQIIILVYLSLLSANAKVVRQVDDAKSSNQVVKHRNSDVKINPSSSSSSLLDKIKSFLGLASPPSLKTTVIKPSVKLSGIKAIKNNGSMILKNKKRKKRQLSFGGGFGMGFGAYDYNDYYGDYASDYAYDYYDWVCTETSCQLCDVLTSECCDPDLDVNCFLPDSCLNNPCLGGGTCITTRSIDNRPDFICVCLPGLSGKYCQLSNDYFVGAEIMPPMIPPPFGGPMGGPGPIGIGGPMGGPGPIGPPGGGPPPVAAAAPLPAAPVAGPLNAGQPPGFAQSPMPSQSMNMPSNQQQPQQQSYYPAQPAYPYAASNQQPQQMTQMPPAPSPASPTSYNQYSPQQAAPQPYFQQASQQQQYAQQPPPFANQQPYQQMLLNQQQQAPSYPSSGYYGSSYPMNGNPAPQIASPSSLSPQSPQAPSLASSSFTQQNSMPMSGSSFPSMQSFQSSNMQQQQQPPSSSQQQPQQQQQQTPLTPTSSNPQARLLRAKRPSCPPGQRYNYHTAKCQHFSLTHKSFVPPTEGQNEEHVKDTKEEKDYELLSSEDMIPIRRSKSKQKQETKKEETTTSSDVKSLSSSSSSSNENHDLHFVVPVVPLNSTEPVTNHHKNTTIV